MEDISKMHGLEEFVEKTYRNFKKDRQRELETKWQNNYDAYKKELDTQWKKGEAGINDSGSGKKNEHKWRSQTFIGITKQKCIAAHAIIVDTIMQGGQVPFFLSDANVTKEQLSEMPKEEQDALRQRREMMEATMKDQLKRCKASRKISDLILSGSIYGESWAKHTIKNVEKKSYQKIEQEDGSIIWEPTEESDRYPNFHNVSIWDMYRDLETASIQKGRAIIQRTPISVYDLRQMTDGKEPGVIMKNVEIVISEQSNKELADTSSLTPALRDLDQRERKIDLLMYWGRVPVKLAKKFVKEEMKGKINIDEEDEKAMDDNEDNGHDLETMIWTANGKIVKFMIGEKGKRPFYRFVWDHNKDSLENEGVADNLAQIQSLMNGAVRAFEDNKKLSSNVMVAIKRRLLMDGNKEFVPGKTFDLSEECEDVRQAIQQIVIQDVGDSLLSMIGSAEQFADDESFIPRVQQGSGGSGRETAFELSQRLEKSGKYLGKVIRNLDYGVIEPFIKDLYEYNMESFIEDDIGQGNYRVHANGFTSFQNRVTKLSALRQILELIQGDPEIREEINIIELYKEFAELLDIDVDRFALSKEDDEGKKEQEAAQAEQQQRQVELEIQKLEAEIALEKARAESMIAESKIKAEELKLRMLEESNKAREMDMKELEKSTPNNNS